MLDLRKSSRNEVKSKPSEISRSEKVSSEPAAFDQSKETSDQWKSRILQQINSINYHANSGVRQIVDLERPPIIKISPSPSPFPFNKTSSHIQQLKNIIKNYKEESQKLKNAKAEKEAYEKKIIELENNASEFKEKVNYAKEIIRRVTNNNESFWRIKESDPNIASKVPLFMEKILFCLTPQSNNEITDCIRENINHFLECNEAEASLILSEYEVKKSWFKGDIINLERVINHYQGVIEQLNDNKFKLLETWIVMFDSKFIDISQRLSNTETCLKEIKKDLNYNNERIDKISYEIELFKQKYKFNESNSHNAFVSQQQNIFPNFKKESLVERLRQSRPVSDDVCNKVRKFSDPSDELYLASDLMQRV